MSGASPLSSSQHGSSSTATATSATTRSGVGRCSSSSCGVYSPVDVRTVGAGGGGAPCLGSPTAGVLLFHQEPEANNSPPRPRAFWREDWLAESRGGGGSRPGTNQCLQSDNFRGCLDGGSGGGGSTPQRLARGCTSQAASASGAAGKVNYGIPSADRGGTEQRVTGRKDEGERVGVYESGGHDSSSSANSGEIATAVGSGRGGVSAAGFALLVSVTVAAFAVGSWVGPPHRQCPPPPPPPSRPPEGCATAPPLPSHQEYEPTLQEMMRVKRGRAAAMKEVGRAQPAAAGGGERHVAGDGAREKRRAGGTEGAELDTANDSAEVVADSNTGAIPGSSDACGEGCRAGLARGGDGVPSPGGKGKPSVATAATQVEGGDSPVAVGGAEGSTPEAGTAAPAISPPGTKEDRSSGSGSRKASSINAQAPPPLPPLKMPSRRFSLSRTSRDESTTNRRRRRRSGAADVGVTPAAFARTLGSAESILAGFRSSGDDEQAARAAARRAAMSRSAARVACESMAWSESGSFAGSVRGRRGAGEDDDDGCNTDAAWRDARREAVMGASSSSATGASTGNVDRASAGGEVKDRASAAAGGGASTRRRSTVDFANVSRGQETEQRDAERFRAGCSGLLLSGNDIQASWAGRYALLGDDEDDDERDAGRETLGARAPHYYYYCLETPPSPRDAVAEGDGQVSSPDGSSGDRGDELLSPRQGSPRGEGRPPALQGVSTRELGLPEVADSGTLCLYWSEADGGRWVLDDDLRLSNGVLGVTEDPAPPEADLAFLDQRHRGRPPQAGVASDGEGGAGGGDRERGTRSGFVREDEGGAGDGGVVERERGTRSGFASEDENGAGDGAAVEREGGFASEEKVSVESGGTTVGGPEGAAGGRALESSMEAAHRAWLLDSPRLQGWVKADDVVVVCETD